MNNSPLMALALTGGGWVIWALIISSIGGVAVAYDRWNLLKEESKALSALRPVFLAALAAGDHDAADKAVKANPGAASRVLSEPENLQAALSDERRHLEGRLLWLGTLGNNAPFVGLFGTVLGVIKAFHDLAESGAGPEVVMAGLSEALVATAVGLLVAIPSVLAFNFLQKKMRDLLLETEALGLRYAAVRTHHARHR
ncbi:MAG: MotA/TolQ/ExbB proton channel family protein [Elusimicrobia bacterium]|nr:MotA/TolQ/ExbB proton channel family protein [Elusimicrobiota bacterium]